MTTRSIASYINALAMLGNQATLQPSTVEQDLLLTKRRLATQVEIEARQFEAMDVLINCFIE